jgi:hypothetical protein
MDVNAKDREVEEELYANIVEDNHLVYASVRCQSVVVVGRIGGKKGMNLAIYNPNPLLSWQTWRL